MDDAFAALDLERRLDLSDDVIELAWRELSRDLHPDSDRGDAERAAAVNRAHQILRSPARRLRHWLGLHGVEIARQSAIDPALMGLFAEIGPALTAADEVLKKRAAASSALARALLAEPEISAQQRLQGLLGKLGKQRADLTARFHQFESDSSSGRFENALAATGQLAFLENWESQVRQRLLAMIAG